MRVWEQCLSGCGRSSGNLLVAFPVLLLPIDQAQLRDDHAAEEY